MKMLIGGKSVDSGSGKTIDVMNPATGELLDTIPDATREAVESCVAIAQEGKRIWRETPLHERSKRILAYADCLLKHRDELTELLCRESGKPITQCESEADGTACLYRSYVEKANHLYGHVLPETEIGQDDNLVFTKREPLGVIAAIAPFNYPLILLGHKMAPALVMGNAVIAKPPTAAPLACMRSVELAVEAGIPAEVVQTVTGRGATVGRWLVQNAGINAVSFTGGTDAGVDILTNSAPYVRRVSLELGGNDPLIICADADLDLAVREAFIGRVTHAGQICCGSKRFIVHESVRDQFVAKLIDGLRQIKMGNPMDRDTALGSLTSREAAIKVDEQVKQTIAQGATCVYGGRLLDNAYFEPTVLTGVTRDMNIAVNMEVFGPVFPIIAFQDIKEAIDIANGSMYGLQGGIITQDVGLALSVAEKLECRCVVLNGSGNYRHMDEPFGGRKMSGMGSEGVSETLEEMSCTKTYVMKNIRKRI